VSFVFDTLTKDNKHMKNVEKFIIIIRNNPSPPPPSSCAALIKFAQLLDLSVSILDTSCPIH